MVYSSAIEIGKGVCRMAEALSRVIEAEGEEEGGMGGNRLSRTELWPGWQRSVTRFLSGVYGGRLVG